MSLACASNVEEMVTRAYSEEVMGGTKTARSADFFIDVPFGSGRRVSVMYVHRNAHIPY